MMSDLTPDQTERLRRMKFRAGSIANYICGGLYRTAADLLLTKRRTKPDELALLTVLVSGSVADRSVAENKPEYLASLYKFSIELAKRI